MNTAQPIRSEQELKDFMNFYEQVQYHPRNQLLLTMGLNTALRISDLLSLQWKQVYDLENRSVREHLLLVEAKTGKASNIYLNEKITVQLQKYYKFLASERSFEISGDAYLFCGKDADPISRVQAYRIIRKAAEKESRRYFSWKFIIIPLLTSPNVIVESSRMTGTRFSAKSVYKGEKFPSNKISEQYAL